MKHLTQNFLTENDRQKVRAAVKDAEKHTSGQIVPMIVSASYHYPMADVTGASAMSFLIAVFLTDYVCHLMWMDTHDMWVFIVLFTVLFAVFHAVIHRFVPLKRLFLSKREINEEVRENAIASFYREGLHRTRHETGILIFISILERKVWILADRGIHEKVDESTWKEIVTLIRNGILEKRQADALCDAIKKIGQILEAHFPAHKGDTDELTDLIVEE